MKFKNFHLFYLLSFVLILSGIVFGNNYFTLLASWHSCLYKISNYFFWPQALFSFITALIYHSYSRKGKTVKKTFVLLHFLCMFCGLSIFTLQFFKLIPLFYSLEANAADTSSLASGLSEELYIILLGLILMIIGLIIFATGIIKALAKNNKKILNK